MRKQYHFRKSANGYHAWDVDRLVALSRDLGVQDVALDEIREIDENYWFFADGDAPTARQLVEHFRLMTEASLDFPIILCAEGRLMDGMHRVLKALCNGETTIRAVRFAVTPEPDYSDVQPDELPY